VPAKAILPETAQPETLHPDVDLKELVVAFQSVIKRLQAFSHHEISAEVLSTRERMSQLLERLKSEQGFVEFVELFDFNEGKAGVVVTFLAVLELVKEHLLEVLQTAAYGQLHVRIKPMDVE
jgi:segregation and condensation protein A